MSVALSPYKPLSPGILLVFGCSYWLMRNHAAFSRRNSFCDRLCVFWELTGTLGVLDCYGIPRSQTRRSLARCFCFDTVKLSSWLAPQPG